MPLYPYQQKVKELVQAGESVILQAPTGAGKTRAALSPFIESFFDKEAKEFPRKCIYSVPMKVLANQFIHEYDDLAASYQRRFRRKLKVSIQTGDRPDDPQFESDLIFTTIDQTLSSFLNVPYGLGKRRANLNAGAIISSYLVFDELHLYDPDSSLPTTLQMLHMLKGITPFIIMTATFSSSMLTQLANLLDAVVVPNDVNERKQMEQIGSQVGKDRRFFAVDAPLTATAVLEHDAARTLCICNTVQSAQDLYEDLAVALKEELQAETAVLKLLHSRYYKEPDRKGKEDWIRDHFGEPQATYTGARLIQVATQVVEVGVDATCDVLHTELSPASSLLQRAGRCARRSGESGKVIVYLPRDEEGRPYFAPYGIRERGRQLCEATWAALQTAEFTNQNMTFSKEQALIDAVHKPVDEQILRELQYSRFLHREKIIDAMRDYDTGRSLIPDLIRDANNCFVFIHPNPRLDDKLTTNPWAYDGFSLFPGTVAKAFKETSASYEMWGVKAVEDDEAPTNERVFKWYPLLESGDVYKTAVIAVSPAIASYSTEYGFRFVPAADETQQSPLREKERRFQPYTYELETYAEHVSGLYRAYQHGIHGSKEQFAPLRDDIAFVAQRIEQNQTFQLTAGSIDQMCRALFACHDLGKLNIAWQAWAHAWQEQVGQFYGGESMALKPDYMAAHTKYNPADKRQREAQKKLGKRPNHAGESAIAGAKVFQAVCKGNVPLLKAALTAVARHHTPQVDSYKSYSLRAEGKVAFQEALSETSLDLALLELVLWQSNGKEALPRMMIHFNSSVMSEVLLYFLLVRVLRLADQRSQIKGG